MEAIVQNTAKVTELLKDRREIDLYPARYAILGSQHNRADVLKNSTEKYAKDPEPYFPYVDPNKQAPKVEAPRLEKDATYQKDKRAYYNPTDIYRKIPQAKIGNVVPVEMKDLRDTFPSEQNLGFLTNKLRAIEIRENSYPVKGIYQPDPRPYYDSSVDDTKSEVSQIVSNINEMKKNLVDAAKNTVAANVGNVKLQKKIQNQINYDAEARNYKQKKNYYTPVENQNGFNVELPVGSVSSSSKIVRQPMPQSSLESAEEVQHVFVEAEVQTPSASTPAPAPSSRKVASNTSNQKVHTKK